MTKANAKSEAIIRGADSSSLSKGEYPEARVIR